DWPSAVIDLAISVEVALTPDEAKEQLDLVFSRERLSVSVDEPVAILIFNVSLKGQRSVQSLVVAGPRPVVEVRPILQIREDPLELVHQDPPGVSDLLGGNRLGAV